MKRPRGILLRLALLVTAGALISEVGGLLALFVTIAVVIVASAGILIFLLSRDRNRTYRPSALPEAETRVPVTELLTRPAAVALEPGEGYEVTR